MSAVSNSVTPRSIALWITLREASRSMRWPKLLQPRPTAETRRPELPRLRISMDHPVCDSRMPLYCDRIGLTRKARPRVADAPVGAGAAKALEISEQKSAAPVRRGD